MKLSEIKKLKIGDTIEVNALHYRIGRKKCKRKIKEIGPLGIGVNLFGWKPFFLKNSEIIKKIN